MVDVICQSGGKAILASVTDGEGVRVADMCAMSSGLAASTMAAFSFSSLLLAAAGPEPDIEVSVLALADLAISDMVGREKMAKLNSGHFERR
jgi:hypothetical protein